MFFFFPFSLGPFGIILLLLFFLLRLIINSLAGGKKNQQQYYRYYEFHQNTPPYEHAQPRVSEQAYTTLGITSKATDEEVKKAYRKLTLEFHPDTIAGKGLGPEFTDFATKRFREVQQAYEQICKERNIK